MKKIIFYSIIFLSFSYPLRAQSTGELLSKSIAQKMKDSLSLTATQRESIYQINMDLFRRKMAMRERYRSNDSLRPYLQKIENERDLLYKKVLPENQYELYRQKKNVLISGK